MPLGGGQNLGTARGLIEISTANLQRVVGVARGVGAGVERAFGQVGAAARRLESTFSRVSRGIGTMRGELGGLALAAGAITGIGINIAGAFEEADVKLSGMTGGIENARKLSAELRKQAAAAGLPFNDMLAAATRLLPTLEGNTKELEKWYDIVKRTAVLNAQEGVSGAAFSINEALSSGGTDLVSLVERFNISRVKLREALAENSGDFRLALDQVLNSMGITTQVAEDMGKTFNASLRIARDAALQLLAEGFTPLLQTMTPVLQQSAEFLGVMRETHPEIALVGAGLATMAAVGAPALLLFNQLVEAGQKLKALGVLSALGRAGAVGLAGGAGVALGIGATNAIGRATGNEQLANAGIGLLIERLQQLVFNISYTFTRVAQLFNEAAAYVADQWQQMIARMLQATAGFLRAVASMIPGGLGGNSLGRAAGTLDAAAIVAQAQGQMRINQAQQFTQNSNAWLRDWYQSIAGPGGAGGAAAAPLGGVGGGAGGGGYTGVQTAAIEQWAASVKQIEADAAAERLATTRAYEQQRSETIANYERGIAREAEDFARARARAAERLQRDIDRIRADGAKREAAWADELNERIAQTRADGNDRIAELERNYMRDRERAATDHRDKLLTAAARLDAVAVREEQRRYARQEQDAATAYDERLDKERANMDERIEADRDAHRERLELAREADRERIADMIASQAEQQRLEDEDRANRLQRQEEEHQRQLAQMATANAERLAQISTQAAEERRRLDESFRLQLASAGLFNEQWQALQDARQKAALASFEKWWGDVNKAFAVQGQAPRPQGPQLPQGFLTDFAGGRAPAGGFPTTFGQAAGRSYTVEGPINIYPAPGMDEAALARAVRGELGQLFRELQQ